MAIELNWVGMESAEEIARVRQRCYGPSREDGGSFMDRLKNNPRAKDGDFLLAREDGEAVGTMTSLSLAIRMRGATFPCQGIAWVGAIKSHRRRGTGDEKGIASQVMWEALRKARERGETVSALMPFRASYYEHFGFGLAEQRVEWIIPMGILPKGPVPTFRFYEDGHFDAICAARLKEAEAGHCDFLTDRAAMKFLFSGYGSGWVFVREEQGKVLGYVYCVESKNDQRTTLKVGDWCFAHPEGIREMLTFLGTLKDQYSTIQVTLPGDVPVNLMLREPQIPHRVVDHPYAISRPYTRMQIRILDHRKVLEALKVRGAGKVGVEIVEPEGQSTKLNLDFGDGGISAKEGGDGAVRCGAAMWASIVGGQVRATEARRFGLISGDAEKARVLDALFEGLAPFSQDYF